MTHNNSSPSSISKKQIFSSALVITFFTSISRVLGLVRDLVLTHFFGASLMMDAWIQAFTIPNLLRRLTAEGSMTLAFIPIYTDLREKEGIAAAKIFAQKSLGLVLWATIFLTALGMIFSPQLVYLVSGGFVDNPEKFNLTVDLTRLMFPYLIFVSIVAWAMGVLNSEKRFASVAAAPILLNISIIGTAFLLSPNLEQPIVGIGWGILIGGIAQVILQIPNIRLLKQSFLPRSPWNDSNISRLLRLLGPALFGVAVYQINIIVLRRIASFLPTGQVTYYYNASRLTELVIGVFALSFTTASFPDLSLQTSKTNWKEVIKTLRFTFGTTLLIVIPSTVGLITIAEPIISMMYLHGKFTWNEVQQTIPTLQAFALSIPAVAAIRLLVSLFYAFEDTKTPVLISAISLFVTGGLGWWLSSSMEIVGLALGLSIGTWFQFLLLLFFAARHKEIRFHWIPWNNILKYLLASIIIGAFSWYVSTFGFWEKGPFEIKNWGIFIGMIGGSSGIYFILLAVFKEPHISQGVEWIKQRINK